MEHSQQGSRRGMKYCWIEFALDSLSLHSQDIIHYKKPLYILKSETGKNSSIISHPT
jgi:hypothetical protein